MRTSPFGTKPRLQELDNNGFIAAIFERRLELFALFNSKSSHEVEDEIKIGLAHAEFSVILAENIT